MKYTYNSIVSFLNKQGWENKGTNHRFSFFAPPLEMGFPKEYLLPVPILFNAPDYNDSLLYVANVIAQFYDSKPETLFYEVDDHLSLLKRHALYLKMSSNEPRLDHSIDFSLIGKFIDNLTKSYQGFFKIRFKQLFLETYRNNVTKVNKVAKNLLDVSNLRLVDLEFRSFSFGVSVDTMMGGELIPYKEIKDWRKGVLPEYEENVLEADYYTRAGIDKIKQQFTPHERRIIYDPIFKSINEDNFSLAITSSDYTSEIKKIRRVPKDTQIEIVPPIEKEDENDKKLHLYQVIVPLDKSTKRATITPKKIQASLFAQEINNLPINEINEGNYSLVFSKPLNVAFEVKEGACVLTIEDFEIQVDADSFELAEKLLKSHILEIYRQWSEDDPLFEARPDKDELDKFFREQSTWVDLTLD